MDYEFLEFRAADLIKLDIMVNGDRVDALSLIVHRSNSISKGRELASKMRSLYQGKCLMLLFNLQLEQI